MAEENTEVDIEAILARLNAQNAEESEDTDNAPEEKHDEDSVPENQNTDNQEIDTKQEESNPSSFNVKPLLEKDVLEQVEKKEEEISSQANVNQQIEDVVPQAKTHEIIQSTEKSEFQETNPLSTNVETLQLADSTPTKPQKNEDDDDYVSPEHESLLARIQKLKRQIFEDKPEEEQLIDEHSFQMLDQQSKNIHLVSPS